MSRALIPPVWRRVVAGAVLLCWAAGCEGIVEELPSLDAGVGRLDGGGSPADGGEPSLADGGAADAGGVKDAGSNDGGAPDGGAPDAGKPDSGIPDAGVTDPCAGMSCAAGSHCVPGPLRCVCNPGYVADAGTCYPGDPGIPELRTQQQVCDAWAQGHQPPAPPLFTKTSATCDPGVLTRAGLDATLARLNLHRWLVGLGPVSDQPSANDTAQKCALVSAWNPAGPSAHFPQPTATCYTAAGASGAGSSNIAWGSGSPQAAIDQWFEDWGNETTMGHRRWLLNPPLGPVGMGYYEGGNNYGSAACISVFSSGGGGPHPALYTLPPAGFAPMPMAQWIWSIHGNALRTQGLIATVTRVSDGALLPVTVLQMNGSYAEPAITLTRQGWQPAAGQTYRVNVTATGMTPLQYETTPVNCP